MILVLKYVECVVPGMMVESCVNETFKSGAVGGDNGQGLQRIETIADDDDPQA